MTTESNPPVAYKPLPAGLSEGPWTTLVMATLLVAAIGLIAAGAYTGGI
ncbi:MAG TPA: hypothetical protein VHP58_01355 [Alphaproteobacteria bacterium]|nr:hypothetical protein [Alphaproteobacteria bacterium]